MSAAPSPLAWWQTWWGMAAIALLCAAPLVWPALPPLLDLPGHMVAYKVEIDRGRSLWLQQYYSLHWAPIGNLGVNLLVVPLEKLVGLERAVKLIVLAIPPMIAAGFLWTAREVHGRAPATALFAVPLAYSYPFVFGFLNFTLSMGACFLAFALWLRLGRLARTRLRAALFVPLSVLVWLAHTFGWGTLGVLAFAAEWRRAHEGGARGAEAPAKAALACLPLAVPVLLMLVWRSGDVAGETRGWLAVVPKVNYILYALRDRWAWVDIPAILAVLALVAWGWTSRRFAKAPALAGAAAFLLLLYLLLPQKIFGSSYADMRIMPFALAVALLALKPPAQAARWLALAGLAFIGLRTAAETASFALYDRSWRSELVALDHVPRGARLVSFVGTPCRGEWTMARLDHLPGLAAVRREAFSNDQWSVAGAQLNRVAYAPAGRFGRDPSQIVRLHDCPVNRWPTLDMSLRQFPRGAFDYLWLVNPPAWDKRLTAGMAPVWTNGRSVLFRIVDRTQPVSLSTDILPAERP
ncbi:MAG: hypothetical protein JOZ90_12180 [Alphaproteobacteria bacterium]|nr:hypothetical protein [Alphaproteobacteria bacterium]MBV9371367.1 hypothetical protein [Alphaproteobacteria bacterium]MBV9901831.1 hypothetical protein [Alphaproteobacteria bacterium]